MAMRLCFILAILSFLLVGCAKMPLKPDFRDKTSQINQQWHSYHLDKRNQVTDHFDSIRIRVPHENKVLFFTKPNHPVHKSLIQRQIIHDKQHIRVDSTGITETKNGRFQHWLNTFIQQDRQLEKKFNRAESNTPPLLILNQ